MVQIANRKEQINKVAQNMFRTKGYAATSMRDLAAEIGIEPASLYSHIKSKEEILQKICFNMADQFFNEIYEIGRFDFNPEEKLQQVITAHVKVITDNSDAAAVFLFDWKHMTEPHLSEFIALRNQYEEIFRSIIREGLEKGVFRKNDEKFIVLTIFSSLNWLYEWYKPEGKLKPEEIANNLSNIILNGLIKK